MKPFGNIMIEKLSRPISGSPKMSYFSGKCCVDEFEVPITTMYPVHDMYCNKCCKSWDMYSEATLSNNGSWSVSMLEMYCPGCGTSNIEEYALAVDENNLPHIISKRVETHEL